MIRWDGSETKKANRLGLISIEIGYANWSKD